jgi:hypothetical protein
MPMQTGSAGLHALGCRLAKESYKAGGRSCRSAPPGSVGLGESSRAGRERGLSCSVSLRPSTTRLKRPKTPLSRARPVVRVGQVPGARNRRDGWPGTGLTRDLTLTLGVLRSWSRWCQFDVRAHGDLVGEAAVRTSSASPGRAMRRRALLPRGPRAGRFMCCLPGSTHRYGPHEMRLPEGVHWVGRTAIILSR